MAKRSKADATVAKPEKGIADNKLYVLDQVRKIWDNKLADDAVASQYANKDGTLNEQALEPAIKQTAREVYKGINLDQNLTDEDLSVLYNEFMDSNGPAIRDKIRNSFVRSAAIENAKLQKEALSEGREMLQASANAAKQSIGGAVAAGKAGVTANTKGAEGASAANKEAAIADAEKSYTSAVGAGNQSTEDFTQRSQSMLADYLSDKDKYLDWTGRLYQTDKRRAESAAGLNDDQVRHNAAMTDMYNNSERTIRGDKGMRSNLGGNMNIEQNRQQQNQQINTQGKRAQSRNEAYETQDITARQGLQELVNKMYPELSKEGLQKSMGLESGIRETAATTKMSTEQQATIANQQNRDALRRQLTSLIQALDSANIGAISNISAAVALNPIMHQSLKLAGATEGTNE